MVGPVREADPVPVIVVLHVVGPASPFVVNLREFAVAATHMPAEPVKPAEVAHVVPV